MKEHELELMKDRESGDFFLVDRETGKVVKKIPRKRI